MVALAQSAQHPDHPAEICLVFSNDPEALGLQKAADMGIEVAAMDYQQFSTRENFDSAMHEILTAHNIQLICCAGYMRILSPWFTQQWPGRILNIHPSLLPKYKGLNTHQRAIDAGDKEHGCTVHYVNEELDGGAIIMQDKTPILPTDTAESLAQRMLTLEHALYVKSLKQIALNL